MILQNIVFPKLGICTEEKLYFRDLRTSANYDYKKNILRIPEGEIVSFNTYFNSFLADRWAKYTTIQSCNLQLVGRGQGILRIYRYSSINGKELLINQYVELKPEEQNFEICCDQTQLYGIIYWEYEAKTDSCIISGEFYTDEPTRNEVSLGVVITTFKREAYVKRNMESLANHLFDKIDDDAFHVFIIDNGQTLLPSSSERITIIPNKNYGGAGGFGRGMLEIYKHGKYNHVIFCDDDAVYEPEAFLRVYNFLSYGENTHLCIGGSMMKLDNPKYMYESGARYFDLEGYPNKNMLDMTKVSSLNNLNMEEYATYHAWWFFAFPISFVEELGLPVPVFFQIDDIEYSLRLREKKYPTAELNGICVWHESFQRKSSTVTSYYWLRNNIIASSLHNAKLTTSAYIKWFTKYVIQSLFVYRYDRARMLLRGAEDALKGADFLMHLDPSTNHQQLLKKQADKPHPVDRNLLILSKYNRPVRNDMLKKLCMLITLNGMLLPGFLRNKGKRVMDKGFVIEPLQGFRAAANFRKDKVMYVDVERMLGFEVQRDSKTFWRLLFKMIKMDVKLALHLSSCRKSYRKMFQEMTSISFWDDYVGKNN